MPDDAQGSPGRIETSPSPLADRGLGVTIFAVDKIISHIPGFLCLEPQIIFPKAPYIVMLSDRCFALDAWYGVGDAKTEIIPGYACADLMVKLDL